MRRLLMLAIAAGGLAWMGTAAQAQCNSGYYAPSYSYGGGYGYAPVYGYSYAPSYRYSTYPSYGYGGGYYGRSNYGYGHRGFGYGSRYGGYGRGVSVRFGF